MAHFYYRGDNRISSAIQAAGGFKPRAKDAPGRTVLEAIAHIQSLFVNGGWKKPADISQYIIASSKGDSVSTSRILAGASYGDFQYKITCRHKQHFYELTKDGSIGAKMNSPSMSGRNPYYILNHTTPAHSDYLIVGTRTGTQEATFFTDIPGSWILSASSLNTIGE